MLENSDTRAIYLFPTKALAQDQLAELYDLNQRLDHRFGVFTYDGELFRGVAVRGEPRFIERFLARPSFPPSRGITHLRLVQGAHFVHVADIHEDEVYCAEEPSVQARIDSSGIRSLVSLLTLAIVYGYFVEPRAWARVTLALASIPVAIMVNGFRVAGTGIAAHYFGPAAAQGFLHEFAGLFMFAAAFAILFALHHLLALVKPRRARTGGAPMPEAIV